MRAPSFTPRRATEKNQAGAIYIDETFYINARPGGDNLLHCFAYGDCEWWRGHPVVRPPASSYHTFEMVTEGDWSIWHQKRELILNAGDILVEKSKITNKWATGPSGHLIRRCLLLSHTPLQNFLCDLLFPHEVTVVHPREPERLDELLRAIRQCILDDGEMAQQDTAALSFRFLMELHRQLNQSAYPDQLVKALNYINATSGYHANLGEVADFVNSSVSTLSRLFRNHLGCSPGQYLIRQRLERACRLLGLHSLSIKKIADECGFSSPMFFARAFKQHYGVSPSIYRQRYR